MEFRSLTIMILFWYYTGGKRTRKGWRKKKNRKLDWSFRPWKQFVISLWHRSGLSRYLGSGIVSWKERSKSHYKCKKCSDRVHEKDWRRKLGGAQDKVWSLWGAHIGWSSGGAHDEGGTIATGYREFLAYWLASRIECLSTRADLHQVIFKIWLYENPYGPSFLFFPIIFQAASLIFLVVSCDSKESWTLCLKTCSNVRV